MLRDPAGSKHSLGCHQGFLVATAQLGDNSSPDEKSLLPSANCPENAQHEVRHLSNSGFIDYSE